MTGSSTRTATHAAMHVKVIGFRSFFTYRWWLKAISADMFKIAALIATTVTCAAGSSQKACLIAQQLHQQHFC